MQYIRIFYLALGKSYINVIRYILSCEYVFITQVNAMTTLAENVQYVYVTTKIGYLGVFLLGIF